MDGGRFEAGTTIGGDFVVESTLLVTAAEESYRVVQRSTGLRRALRVVSLPSGDSAAVARLIELARGGPVIGSEFVPAAVDAGYDPQLGIAWFATADVEGVPLSTLLATTGPLPIGVAADVMAQLFDAVVGAHEMGVSHGALRADNVFVATVPRRGEVYRVSVSGFGLRLLEGGTRGGMEPWREVGGSPESSDVRSLAQLAFALLSGGRPVGESGPVATLRALPVPGAGELGWFDGWFQACVVFDDGQFPSVMAAEAAWEHAVRASARASARASRSSMALGAAVLVGLTVSAPLVWLGSRRAPRAAEAAAALEVAAHPPCPEGMVWLAGGQFLMGSRDDRGDDDQRPRHVVRMSEFCLDRTEVTVGAYGRYWAQRGHPAALEPDDGLHCNWGHDEQIDHPINCVDWTLAREYCEWSGHPGGARRLPTEAQWEYAAHGPEGARYPWGRVIPAVGVCWSGVTPRLGTCSVREPSQDRTSTGILGLAGNVSEWTADFYAPGYDVPDGSVRVDPTGPASVPDGLRVFRGGTWTNSVPSALRAASRLRHTETMRSRGVGFRCARAP